MESTGTSTRYHAQDGRHPGDAIFCGLLAEVACVPCISKNGVQDFKVNWCQRFRKNILECMEIGKSLLLS